MAVVTDQFRSFSKLKYEEYLASVGGMLGSMTEAEQEVFYELLCAEDLGLELEMRSVEYDREMVDIQVWLDDPYFMGESTKSLYGVWRDDLIELFASKQYSTCLVVGSLGCVDESTRIMTEHGIQAIGDIKNATRFLSFDGKNPVFRSGIGPFPKGKGDLYRVVTEHSEFVAFGSHLIFCSDCKYRSVAELTCGDALFWHSSVASLFLPDSSEGISQQESLVDGQSCFQIILNCLDDYLEYCHQCDPLFLGEADNVQAVVPLLNDVLKFVLDVYQKDILRKGGQKELGQEYNHLDLLISRLSKMDSFYRKNFPFLFVEDYFVFETFLRSFLKNQSVLRFLPLSEFHQKVQLFFSVVFLIGVSEDNNLLDIFLGVLSDLQLSPRFVYSIRTCWKFLQNYDFHQKIQSLFECNSYPQFSSPIQSTIKHISICKRNQWYWDLQVAGTNCYFHDGGFVSHNSGKSTFAHFAIARMIYEISCLRDPQKTYDLSSGSEIVFVNLAPVKETARKVLFEGVLSKINQSPYFMNEFSPINKRSKDLYNFKSFDVTFPKCISLVSGSSTDSSFLGRNVIGGVIDELNFFHADPKYLALRKKTERWGEFSKAGKLFDSIMRRMKSRFLKRGRLPGILIGTSSKTTESSLTSRLINDAVSKHDSTMFVRDRAIIDVKANSFSDKKFKILVGNAFYHSRILKYGEDLSEIESPRVIDIPEDLRTDFENDINAALRDLAGIDTLAIDLFFSNIEKIHACVDRTRKHPFCCWAMEDNGWWDSKSSYTIDWKVICRRIDNGDWIPKLDPDRPRFIHLDPALTGDAFGLSIVHVKGYQKVERKVPDKNEVYEELLPVFVVDFMLKIAGSKDDEIQFKNVRQIIYQFSEHGFQISKVTSDKFQSREMLQQLESQGYSTELISVDEDIEPYAHFRRVVYDERISYYHYSSLIDEMIKLESIGNKVDHPRTGSKDIADSLCGVLWSLYLDGNYGNVILPQKGISNSEGEEFFDENFNSMAKEESPLRIVYTKPSDKSVLKPSYKKVKLDKNQDISDSIFDLGIFMERG